MEFDDLQSAWQTLDRRLEQQNAMQLNLIREGKLSKVRSGLRWLQTGQILQILWGAALVLVFAPFWIEHRDVPHLALCGLALHAYGLMFVLFAARDLMLIARVDYSAPVLNIQKQLANLRAWRMRRGLWLGITACFIWVPLMLVILYWAGLDLWLFKPVVVGWFVVSSAVGFAVMLGIIGWLRHPSRTKLKRALDADAAGRSVRRAEAVLEEISQFERA